MYRKNARLGRYALILALFALPATAQAGDKYRAARAIAEARSQIDAAASIGALSNAADVQARAMAALGRAERHLRKGNEDHAIFAAREAEALGGLAAATSDYRRLAAR